MLIEKIKKNVENRFKFEFDRRFENMVKGGMVFNDVDEFKGELWGLWVDDWNKDLLSGWIDEMGLCEVRIGCLEGCEVGGMVFNELMGMWEDEFDEDEIKRNFEDGMVNKVVLKGFLEEYVEERWGSKFFPKNY